MIVSVPFAYDAEYVEKGMRSFRQVQLRGELPVRIKEVDASRAVLAFKVADASGFAPEFSPVGERARRIVSVDGRLWRELMPLEDFARLIGRRWDDEIADAGGERDGYEPEHPLRVEWENCKHDNPFALLGRPPHVRSRTRTQVEAGAARAVREWKDDNGRAHVAKIRERLSDIACIDDSVFEACMEPTWVVDVGPGADGEVEAVVRLAPAPRPEGKGGEGVRRGGLPRKEEEPRQAAAARLTHAVVPDAYGAVRFAADRLHDAVDFASRLGAEDGTAIRRVRVASAARVFLPGAVTYPDDCVALEAAAGGLLVACARYLSTAPREAVRAWRDLREASLRSGQVDDGVPLPKASGALAEAMSEIVRTWTGFYPTGMLYGRGTGVLGDAADAFDRHGAPFRLTVDFAEALHGARQALSRWVVRPANGREWAAHASPAWGIDPESPEILGGVPVNVVELTTLADVAALGAIVDLDLSREAAMAGAGSVRILAATHGRRVIAAATFDCVTGEVDRHLLAAAEREEAAERALSSFARRGLQRPVAPRPF